MQKKYNIKYTCPKCHKEAVYGKHQCRANKLLDLIRKLEKKSIINFAIVLLIAVPFTLYLGGLLGLYIFFGVLAFIPIVSLIRKTISQKESSGYNILLKMSGYDQDLVERLILHESKKRIKNTRSQNISRALFQWQKDRK